MLCPICKRTVARTGPFLPFCSERCKNVDLGNWAMEKYVISTPFRPGMRDLEEASEADE